VTKDKPSYAYDARASLKVSELHDGSVPPLAELLKPAAERVRFLQDRFRPRSDQDLVNVGLAVQ
jgi:hypothetical protein